MTDDSLPPATEAQIRADPEKPSTVARLNDWISSTIFARLDRQLLIVLIMVSISVLGAVSAYRTGLAEQRSILLERRLAHGQIQDIGFRQQWLAEILVRVGFVNSMNRLTSDATDHAQAYRLLPDASAGLQDILQWRVTEAHLQRQAFRPVTDFLRDTSPAYKTLEAEMAALSAEELRRQGFLAVADASDTPRPAVLFPGLQRDIANAHDDSVALSFCVLLFVFGLVCLTLAELDLGPPLVWASLTALGTTVAAGTVVALLRIDPGAVWLVILSLLFVALATWLAVWRGFFRLAEGRAHAPHPEAPEPGRVSFAHLAGHTSHDGWSRTIVLFITAAVFASAVFGWLYSVALNHAGHYALEAQEKKTELVNLRSRLSAAAMGGSYDGAISVLVARIRCSAATQLAAIAAQGETGADPVQAAVARDAACSERDKIEKSKGFIVDWIDGDSLMDSATSPARHIRNLVMNRENGPDLTLALSDGLSELSAGWSNRAALLLAVLTILAISLYLFGQAYSMGQTIAGRWLIRSGASLLFLSAGVGLIGWAQPLVDVAVESLPDECVEKATEKPAGEHHGAKEAKAHDEGHVLLKLAARHYAQGVAQKNLADSAPSGSGREAAADRAAAASLKCAILARPGFVPAYQVLQSVLADRESPQRSERGHTSLLSRSSLDTLQDLRREELKAFVRSGMLRPLGRLGNFAFGSTILALSAGDRAALAEARTTLDMITGTASWWRALQVEWFKPELWSEEPSSKSGLDWFNLALSQLVTGEPDQLEEAERNYDRALRNADDWTPDLLAATLTDIEIVRALCSNLHPDGQTCARIFSVLERVRPRIANGVDAAAMSTNSAAAVGDFWAEATASTFSWKLRLVGFDDKRDRLSVAWYRDETAPGASAGPGHWPVRRVLAAAFHMYYPGGKTIRPLPDGAGLTGREVSYLDESRECVAPGNYVAEVYLNGRQVASRGVTVGAHGLRYKRSRELDLNWCMPSAWKPLEDAKGKRPAWLGSLPARGFAPGTGASGQPLAGAMMTFIAPASMGEARRQSYFLRQAVQVLLRKGDPGAPPSWSQAAEDREVAQAVPLSGLTPADCRAAEPLGRPVYHLFTNPSNANLVHVGIVDGRGTASEACTILRSLTTYF